MMRLYVLMTFIFSSMVLSDNDSQPISCKTVLKHCQNGKNIPRCVENKMRNCIKGRNDYCSPELYVKSTDSSTEARVDTVYGHVIHIPSEAVLKSREAESDDPVKLIVSVLNRSLFEAPSKNEYIHEHVLGVWLGEKDVEKLSQPVRMVFVNASKKQKPKCVFWKLSENIEQGSWKNDGCNSIWNNTDLICECNHLSFFAVLVSPDAGTVDNADVERLEYITYIGSSLSVVFTIVTLVLFLCQRKRKSDHSVVIHMQLTGSLFLLHLFFLSSSFWSESEKAACLSLGLLLHWALLATFTWTAIEGFHLYLLLIRVFNIYIRRYLLRLNLVGWGVPTITVMICGIAGSYGKYTLKETTSNSTDLCWVTSKAARYITVNGYLGLVLLFNIVILAVVVVKIRQMRRQTVQVGNRVKRVWMDWATVLGLSCVLGLPWGLAFTTHGPLSRPGIYLHTIFNAFQGPLMFLWFLSVTWKSRKEEQQSTKNISLSNTNL